MIWTLKEIEPLIERLGNPVAVTKGQTFVAINRAFEAALGYSRAQLVGRPYSEFLPAEEVAPLKELNRRRTQGEAPEVMVVRANALDSKGARRPWLIYITALPTEDPAVPLVLSSCSEVPEAVRDLALTERVVQLAAALASERSEDRVRAAVVSGFESFGVSASISRIESATRATPLQSSRGAPEPELQFFHEAVESRRPVFLLPPGTDTYTVYIPVFRSDGAHELLVLWSSPFETIHLSLLTLFSRQLGATLENTLRMGELGQRNHELMLLLELARTTAATLDLKTILEVACDFVTRLLDVSNCFILLLDARKAQLRAVATSANARSVIDRISMSVDAPSLAARAARERRPQAIEDVSRADAPVRMDLVQLLGEKAILALPMTARTELIGVIVVDDTRAPRRFSPELISLAEATASQLALSVQSAQLYESLKDSYAQLARTRAEMVKQERLAALGELSAIVAHEVRNPLGVIFNAVASLRRGTQADPDASMLLEIVKEECERLNRIVSDLLDFSRPMGLLLEEEDLASLVNESVAAAVAGAGAEAPWTVETRIDDALPRATVDRQALRQALMNVIINALQAMPRGGKIVVRAVREDGSVRIDVQDEGVGIAPDIRPRIFEPFFTTKAKGTGLGLAVVKRILEDHRGEVQLASEPGRGTTFTFKLPLTNASEKVRESL